MGNINTAVGSYGGELCHHHCKGALCLIAKEPSWDKSCESWVDQCGGFARRSFAPMLGEALHSREKGAVGKHPQHNMLELNNCAQPHWPQGEEGKVPQNKAVKL